MFKHIGISINDPSDIDNFYIDILKFTIQKKFTLNAALSEQIFNISKRIEIVTVEKNNLIIELLNTFENLNNYFHICISVDDRNELIKKAKEREYPCTIIKKNPFDMVFIRDRSNNLFEVKQN